MDNNPPDISKLSYKSTQMTGALNDLKEAKEEAETEKPLVSVSVNNPVSWLMKVINNLKKKQTTTITFRLGVPLIALPVIIAALAGVFFGLGKYVNKTTPTPTPTASPIPTPVLISKVGFLVVKADLNSVLILPQGNTLTLRLPEGLDVSQMKGKRVLVTGLWNQTQNSLTVEKPTDIETLKPLPSPTASPSV